MAFVECPHCLTEVLPMADGRCPSCQRPMTGVPVSNLAKLRATPDLRYPDTCCTCGFITSEVERLAAKTHGAEPFFLRLFSAVAAAFIHRRLLSDPALKGDEVVFEIEIPRCAECRSQGPLVPEHVNLEHQEMVLFVLRSFREAVAAINHRPVS